MIMGTVDHITTNWLLGGRKGSLRDMVDPIIDTIMEGVLAGPGDGCPQRAHWSAWPHKYKAPEAKD